jgi:hypothetical protein
MSQYFGMVGCRLTNISVSVAIRFITVIHMILELKQILPLDTPLGPAFAHFLLDYGTEHHLIWVCFMKSTGECWSFENPFVKLAANPTLGVRTEIGK